MESRSLNPSFPPFLPPQSSPGRRRKKRNRERSFLPWKFRFPISTRLRGLPRARRGGEGERVDKKKPRKRRGVEESGRRRERERERVGGGVWRARAVSQPSPVPTYPCTSESARRVATVGVGNDGERIFPLVGRATSAR